MKKILLIVTLLFGLSLSAEAFSFTDWLKNRGPKKPRKRSSQTMVAAVRGVEELGDIDPQARDFDGVHIMGSMNPSSEELQHFIEDGKLQTKKRVKRVKNADAELEIGKDVAANIIAQFGLYKDANIADYVNLTGLTVAQHTPKQNVTYRFAVLDSDILNAFAAPGGYIFITRGLLDKLKDEAQLACILAHEIGHISNEHVMKEIEKAKMVDKVIPAYAKAGAQRAKWMKQVTDLAIKMFWKGLSKKDELQSDRFAIQYAKKAGYDPVAFWEVLTLLKSRAQRPEGMEKDVKFILSTHPKSEERLVALEKKIDRTKPGGLRIQDRFQSIVKISGK